MADEATPLKTQALKSSTKEWVMARSRAYWMCVGGVVLLLGLGLGLSLGLGFANSSTPNSSAPSPPAPPPPAGYANYDSWKVVLLHDAVARRAQCLDGSAPGYYVERGAARGMLIHLQGGGWCTSIDDCTERATTPLGSSTSYENDRDAILAGWDGGAHGLFSNSSTVNPFFHNYTKVYVRYCDGGSFSGDTVTESPNGTLYFRGKRILDAVLDALIDHEGLMTTDLLIANGCSAGGLAIWQHVDYMSSFLRGRLGDSFHILGVPECGLFMDLPTANGSAWFTPMLQRVAIMQNATAPAGNLNAACLASYPAAEAWRCFLAQYTLPHVHTPCFAVNSVYDAWQTANILQVNPNCDTDDPTKCSKSEAAAIEGLRVAMVSNLTAAPSCISFFLYTCATHCGQLEHTSWTDLSDDDEQSLGERIAHWALNGEAHRSLPSQGWTAQKGCGTSYSP